MTGEKGERTVNGHLVCLRASIESLDVASSICNFKAPGRALKRCVHSACLFSVCVYVAHYSFVSPEWIVSIRALCAQSEGRRELHLDMRSQIIHLTLRQEGSTERRRARLNEWEGGNKGTSERREREKQTSDLTVSTANKWKEAVFAQEKTVIKGCIYDLEQVRQSVKKKWGWMLLCFSYQVSSFIAYSFANCSGGFSAPLMSIVNLCKHMDYAEAKLATKHSIIRILHDLNSHLMHW